MEPSVSTPCAISSPVDAASTVELTRSPSHPPSGGATVSGEDRIAYRRRSSLVGSGHSSAAKGSDFGIGFAPRRRNSLKYFRLAVEPLLRLSVLKLDGSTYDVEVAKTARVGELKIAIENLFRQPSDDKDGSPDISWSHVWGHFCLSFDDVELTDDKAYIQTFGIKDGDQLRFIRHLSFNQGSSTIERKWRMEKLRKSLTRTQFCNKAYQRKDSQGTVYSFVLDEDDDLDDGYNKIEYCDKIDEYSKIGHANFSIAQLFRELFSYSRVRTARWTKA